MSEMTSDQDLMYTFQQGDESALEKLLSRWHVRLYAYIRQRVQNSSDVDEILQDTIGKIISALRKNHQPANFAGWAYIIAKNTIINHVRNKNKHPANASDSHMQNTPDNSQDALDGMIDSDMANSLKKAIDVLASSGPQGARKVEFLQEFYFNNLKIKDIAEKTGTPVGSVKRILHSAKKDLLKLLQQYGITKLRSI